MSSRVLRRLREEKEAADALLLAANEEEEEEVDNEESSEEEEDGGGGGGAFSMMLDEDSSSEEESDDSEEGDEKDVAVKTATPARSKKAEVKEEEEDLDAILSDMNIQSSQPTDDGEPESTIDTTIRVLLLSKTKGYDTQDLDLDNAMRTLLGGDHGANPMNMMNGVDGAQPQQQQRGRGRGGNNARGRRTLAKKYLFGKPKQEWGKPPSYVGGGLGVKELSEEVLEEERHSWKVPWPYNLDSGEVNAEGNGDIPRIPALEQKWFTLQMSDTYQEHNYVYQEMLSTHGSSQQAGMHDPNSLAMFVADHPYFAETILQLAMVLYYINDRGRGNDLLRRCMFLYEAALPSNVLPSNDAISENNGSGMNEMLIDIERQPNSGLFATLFRIMQTSGMTGCHNNALATGRYLLSLDPLRDPMSVLLILDYYALASRRTTTITSSTEEVKVEVGASFIVDLVESDRIAIHYKDPLTDRHHWCPLIDMPNWAYSYALALYRLSRSAEGGLEEEHYEERAEDALVKALHKFPTVLPKFLAMNKVNTQDRAFRMDWPSVMLHFSGGANEASIAGDTVEERVTRASGEHVVRIFVERCHKFWKEENVVQWLYQCSERVVQENKEKVFTENNGGVDGDGNEQPSPPTEAPVDTDATATNDSSSVSPPLSSNFSPALARYAQCDPSEYEDAFHTFPPEAIALDPNIVAPAMALGDGRRRFRRGQQHQRGGRGGMGGDAGGQDPLEVVRQMIGLGGNDGPGDVEVLDPDSPLLQLYLQSLLPWAQVEGVRPPPRG